MEEFSNEISVLVTTKRTIELMRRKKVRMNDSATIQLHILSKITLQLNSIVRHFSCSLPTLNTGGDNVDEVFETLPIVLRKARVISKLF
jgi:hypothetical protein